MTRNAAIEIITKPPQQNEENSPMAKEQVKHISAVFTSMYAHAGHITKEEAKEISGMDDHEFEKAYEAAANINKGARQAKGIKRDRFMAHFF